MNVLVVHYEVLEHFPPVRNLVQVLLRNGHRVTLITVLKELKSDELTSSLKLIPIPEFQAKNIFAPVDYIMKNFSLRDIVQAEMKNNDILWTTTDGTVRALGALVYRYKHIMQLMELIEDIPAFPRVNFIKYKIYRFARKAYKVVVPEYNRAHITQAWWDLKKVPNILPNKMLEPDLLKIPDKVAEILNQMENEDRKIVLYQGVFYADRNLDLFVAAVEKLNKKYVLYLMGRATPYKKYLCDTYGCRSIEFIAPPYHLAITQKAYIGLLPYVAGKLKHYSILNGLYCAPNKIYEYAFSGVPMIGTDVPGLQMPFMSYDIGYICSPYTVDSIIDCLEKIDERYDELSKNCHEFYDSVDMDKIVEEILVD